MKRKVVALFLAGCITFTSIPVDVCASEIPVMETSVETEEKRPARMPPKYIRADTELNSDMELNSIRVFPQSDYLTIFQRLYSSFF